jgi:hypothetical protein
LNVASAKKTLYEILDVAPNASLPEIQAAHRRLCRKLLLGKSGQSREDIDFNLKVIDVALHTLSDQASRDTYDAQLSARTMPVNAVVPLRADAASLKVAAAIEENQRITAVIQSGDESPLKILSTTAASSVSALTKIFRGVVGLIALGAILKMSTCILAGRQPERGAGGVSKAEEKVILQEYYQTHGVRPGSKIEADLLEVESRRKENERREAAREKEKEEERYRRFVEDSRRTGQQASENLRRAEERARYEEEHKRQQLERERRFKEEAERQAENMRLEEARRKAGLDQSSQKE